MGRVAPGFKQPFATLHADTFQLAFSQEKRRGASTEYPSMMSSALSGPPLVIAAMVLAW
jgi:hypothetical protein